MFQIFTPLYYRRSLLGLPRVNNYLTKSRQNAYLCTKELEFRRSPMTQNGNTDSMNTVYFLFNKFIFPGYP